MRILHVLPHYYPAVRYGDRSLRTMVSAERWPQEGTNCTSLITTNIDGLGITATPIAAPVDLDGVQVKYFPCPLLRRVSGRRHAAAHFTWDHVAAQMEQLL